MSHIISCTHCLKKFSADPCAGMVFMCRLLLKSGGALESMANIMRIVSSIARYPGELKDETWREGYCSRLLEIAHNRKPDDICIVYFLEIVPRLSPEVLSMMQAACPLVLKSEIERPVAKPGPLERWAARRGW